MKNKIIFFLFILIILSSCKLAKEKNDHINTNQIGWYITTTNLNFINNQFKNDSKIMATPIINDSSENFSYTEFVFENIDGYAYFLPTTIKNNELYQITNKADIINNSMLNVVVSKDNTEYQLTGQIIFNLDSNIEMLYFNPVFQENIDTVYLIPTQMGEGLPNENTSINNTLSSDIHNQNEKINSLNISVNITATYPPNKFIIIQMDNNHNVLKQIELNQTNLLNNLILEQNTEYIIVQTYYNDQIIYDHYNYNDQTIELYAISNNDFIVKKLVELIWFNQK